MTEQQGAEKTKALSKYIGGGVVMTKSIATEIVETLWGTAPGIEKTKCILLCQTYQLNPLMKHIYLIGYKRYKDRKLVVDGQGNPILDWSIQQGIGSTRLLAQRKHNYSYLDMTPRRATQAEIDKVFGDEADTESLYAFVWIKDNDTGAEVTAVRGIPKGYNVKGLEKGNTLLNQVCIWTERQALDRQYPGEMPPNIEVVDERYIDIPDVGRVNTDTGEISDTVEGEATELSDNASPPPPAEHWCAEHNCAFELKKSRYGSFYAHKTDDGWCNEAKKKEPAPATEVKSKKPTRDPETIKTLNDLFKACNEDFKLQPAEVIKELGVETQSDISDTPAECYRRISAVR